MPLGPEDITLTGKTLTGGTISGSSLTGVTFPDSTANIKSISVTTAVIYPTTSEGVALGSTTNRWAGVFTSSGVNFPAAVDASGDVNTLDDYEEGTFTPTWTPATTGSFTIGYNAATTGTYTKVGNKVYCQGFVQVTTFTSGTGTGQMGLSGLPFTAGGAPHQGVFTFHAPSSGLRAPFTALVSTATGIARAVVRVATTGASSALNLADLTTAGNQFNFSGSYMV